MPSRNWVVGFLWENWGRLDTWILFPWTKIACCEFKAASFFRPRRKLPEDFSSLKTLATDQLVWGVHTILMATKSETAPLENHGGIHKVCWYLRRGIESFRWVSEWWCKMDFATIHSKSCVIQLHEADFTTHPQGRPTEPRTNAKEQ